MNLDLARRFMLEFLPPDAQVPVQDVWEALAKNPLMILHNSLVISQFQLLRQDQTMADKNQAVATARGIICGFALAYSMRFPEVEKDIEGYLEHAAKSRGDNVVSFTAKRGI